MGQGMEAHGDALGWSFAACALLLCSLRVSFFLIYIYFKFNFMCMCVLFACMSVHACMVPQEARRGCPWN